MGSGQKYVLREVLFPSLEGLEKYENKFNQDLPQCQTDAVTEPGTKVLLYRGFVNPAGQRTCLASAYA